MVLIEPAADGAIRLNAYGLDGGEIVDLLRRSLLHVVAMQAGVEVISVEVPAHGAVVASRPAPKAMKTPRLSSNGSKPRQTVPTYSLASLGLDEDEDE
jgi:hypothetical protein